MTEEELIARLQTATYGSLDLDWAIWRHLVAPRSASNLDRPPPYTVQIHRALELAPAWYVLDHLCEHYRIAEGRAQKTGGATCKLAYDAGGRIGKIEAEGATLALAVCIAALKARATEEPLSAKLT